MENRDRAALSHTVETPAGSVAVQAVFTGCRVQCSRCSEWFPLSEVGLRIFREGDVLQVRNQPRCTRCRHLKPPPGP